MSRFGRSTMYCLEKSSAIAVFFVSAVTAGKGRFHLAGLDLWSVRLGKPDLLRTLRLAGWVGLRFFTQLPITALTDPQLFQQPLRLFIRRGEPHGVLQLPEGFGAAPALGQQLPRLAVGVREIGFAARRRQKRLD